MANWQIYHIYQTISRCFYTRVEGNDLYIKVMNWLICFISNCLSISQYIVLDFMSEAGTVLKTICVSSWSLTIFCKWSGTWRAIDSAGGGSLPGGRLLQGVISSGEALPAPWFEGIGDSNGLSPLGFKDIRGITEDDKPILEEEGPRELLLNPVDEEDDKPASLSTT